MTGSLALRSHEIAAGSQFAFEPSALHFFSEVPKRGHYVVALCGMVAVYESDWREVVEGGLYVVERQHPPGGMSWETYDRFNRQHGPGEPRCRIITSREVIQARRLEAQPDAWWFVLPGGSYDGPLADWALGYSIVGKVVGIYRPAFGGEPS